MPGRAFRCFTLVYASVVSLTLGCESKKAAAPIQSEPTQRNANRRILKEYKPNPPGSPSRIEAGAGVRGCYVGMRATLLSDEWKLFLPTRLSEYGFDNYYEPDRGISLVARKKLVEGISFIYDLRDWPTIYHAFDGTTAEGIGKDATIADVINCYGQPVCILNMTASDEPKAMLAYKDLGITFEFRSGKVTTIGVSRPDPTYDPYWDADSGDTSEYRAIVPQTPREQPVPAQGRALMRPRRSGE